MKMILPFSSKAFVANAERRLARIGDLLHDQTRAAPSFSTVIGCHPP
jgi:hypothetical protein